MKKTLLPFALCILIFSIYSCKKDNHDSHPGPDPVQVDLTVKVNCSVAGYVMDESGDPVKFASVYSGDKTTTTDQYGYFTISGVALPQAAGLVKIVSGKYFTGYKTFLPQKDKEAFVRIAMMTKTEIGTVDAASGGEASTTDGGKVVLPANGIVTAASGAAYTGQVHVSARWIDPASASDPGIPGDGRGVDNSSHLKALKSYGVMAIELSSDGGQLLQIAPGKTAGITIPVTSALSSAAPSSIALWSFNDSLGLWKQESVATRTGNMYVGTTSHFSFWDGAEGVDLVNFKAKVLDAASHPLAGVPVSIMMAGVPLNAGYGRFGYTDADGNVTGAVFANSSLVFQVLTTCSTSAYAQPFSTTSTDVDLGQVMGNMGQTVVTLTGTVQNCEGQPVTSGYIQTYDHGFYNRIPINNGSFSFSGVACTNQEVSVVAIDNSSYQQCNPKIVTLTAGNNDLGVLKACGTSTMGSLSFTLDGETTNITEPKDTIGGYFLVPVVDDASKWTQVVTLSGNPNASQQMAFQFDGPNTASGDHHVTEVFCNKFASGRGYWPEPITVTITEYGEIGGFISGSFSNQMLDFGSNSLHTLSCTFRVRRYN